MTRWAWPWPAGMPPALRLGLLWSLVLHAVLLSVQIHDPQALSRLFEDTRLEVVLVNVPARERNSRSRTLAQASVTGGGDAGAATAATPSPAASAQRSGAHSEDAQQRLDVLRDAQQRLLTQVQQQLAQWPQPQAPISTSEAQLLEEKRQQLLQVQGQIERRLQSDSANPRRRYVGPDTREVVYAQYYDSLRRRIELRGTRHFPQREGRKLYGELVVMLTVNAYGELMSADILDGSGDAALDRQALAIAQAAAPFGRFSLPMRQRFDELAVVTRFRFAREEDQLTLQAATGPTRSAAPSLRTP